MNLLDLGVDEGSSLLQFHLRCRCHEWKVLDVKTKVQQGTDVNFSCTDRVAKKFSSIGLI